MDKMTIIGIKVALILVGLGSISESFSASFYCSALSIEGDLYYFSPVFEGKSEKLECYTTALDDHLEDQQQYSFSPSCMFEDEKAELVDHYQTEMADSKAIFGDVKELDWLPSCS